MPGDKNGAQAGPEVALQIGSLTDLPVFQVFSKKTGQAGKEAQREHPPKYPGLATVWAMGAQAPKCFAHHGKRMVK